MAMRQTIYPVRFSVDYPDRSLNRLTSAFRIFVAIPIMFVLGPCVPAGRSDPPGAISVAWELGRWSHRRVQSGTGGKEGT